MRTDLQRQRALLEANVIEGEASVIDYGSNMPGPNHKYGPCVLRQVGQAEGGHGDVGD